MSFGFVNFFFRFGGSQKNLINDRKWPIFFAHESSFVLNHRAHILAEALKMLFSRGMVYCSRNKIRRLIGSRDTCTLTTYFAHE